jgi:hypothetical protein
VTPQTTIVVVLLRLNNNNIICIYACLGVLRIVGDPGSGGDIALRLEANETVVSITAGSKNLTLIKPLDKEVSARRDE